MPGFCDLVEQPGTGVGGDQGGGLQGVPGRLLSHLDRRQFAQLLIDQRQQFCRGLGVALTDRLQKMSHVAHGANKYQT